MFNKTLVYILVLALVVAGSGFLIVQAKELNSGNAQNNYNFADGPSCETAPEMHSVSSTKTEEMTFLAEPYEDCEDAAKKHPITDEKIKKITGAALNECKDELFLLKQHFTCQSPCKPISNENPPCSITDGPRMENIRECGQAGRFKKCCATLTATASGAVTQWCQDLKNVVI